MKMQMCKTQNSRYVSVNLLDTQYESWRVYLDVLRSSPRWGDLVLNYFLCELKSKVCVSTSN